MAIANTEGQGTSEGQVSAPTREPTQPAPVEQPEPVTEPATEEAQEDTQAQEPTADQSNKEEAAKETDELLPEADPEPTPEEEEPKEDEQPEKWDVTGDANLDAVYELMSDAGMQPGDEAGIFDKALQTGDMNQVDVALLIEKVGKAKATLIMAGATQYYEGTYKAILESKQKAFEAVGGEDNWGMIRDWAQAKEKADKSFSKDLNELRSMIDAGGRSTMAAVNELKGLYEAEKGSIQVNLVHGDGGSKPSVGEPITDLASYFDQLQAAHQRGDQAAVSDIKRRRAAARK